MAALLGAEWDLAQKIADEAAEFGICDVANDNGGGQVVLSGDKAAIDKACEIAKAKGVKRAILLPVSAPFPFGADGAGRFGDGSCAQDSDHRCPESAGRGKCDRGAGQ